LLDAEIAEGADPVGFALKSRQVQGHGSGGLVMGSGQLMAVGVTASKRLAKPGFMGTR